MKVNHPDHSKGNWVISGDRIERGYPKKSITLKDNVKEIKVLYHSEAREAVTGRDGLPRAAAGAVLGFLIAGPVGTVLGAGAGASGAKAGQAGRSESCGVTITFANHQYLIGDVSMSELEQIREFLDHPAQAATDPVDRDASVVVLPAAVSKAKLDVYAALPEPIKDRAAKQKPFLISKLTEKFGDPPESRGIALFFRHLQVAMDCLNTIKWRHYDQEVESDQEIAEIVAIALSATSHQIRQLSSLSGSADEVLEFLIIYFAPLISEMEVQKAWLKPKPSSVIAKAGAFKIFKKCKSLDRQSEPAVELEPTRGESGDGEFNHKDAERRLTSLKDLLERGVISENEYKMARLKVLGI